MTRTKLQQRFRGMARIEVATHVMKLTPSVKTVTQTPTYIFWATTVQGIHSQQTCNRVVAFIHV